MGVAVNSNDFQLGLGLVIKLGDRGVVSRGWTGIRVRVRVRAFFLAVRSKELFPIVDLDVSDQVHSS